MSDSGLPILLLIDDDVDFVASFKVGLGHKYQIVHFDDFTVEAYEVLRKKPVAICLVDIYLSQRKAWIGIQQIKKIKKHIPLIAISETEWIPDFFTARGYGADVPLEKNSSNYTMWHQFFERQIQLANEEINLTIISADDDYEHRVILDGHLKALVDNYTFLKQIVVAPGEFYWDTILNSNIDLLICMLSRNFVSDYEINEMLPLFQTGLNENGRSTLLVPVKLSSVMLPSFLDRLQCVPRNDIPIELWENKDLAYFTVVKEIENLILMKFKTF